MEWWRGRRAQLDEEIETHIELEVRENIESGMSQKEARHAAMKAFGNVPLIKERTREMWGWIWPERLLRDIRYAFRGLRNAPAYAITVALTLALGLGSATAMLAIVDSVLLRPVALPHPEQLVMMFENAHDGSTYALNYQQIEALRRNARSFTAVNAYNTMVRPIETTDGTRMAVLTEVTPQFFNMLGVHAKIGRLMGDMDEKAPVVLVSAAFWRERLHANPNAVGMTLRLSGELRTVIGVLPEGLHFPQGTEAPVVFKPFSLNAKDSLFDEDSASVIARMKPGVSTRQALEDARSVLARSGSGNKKDTDLLGIRSYKDYLTGNMQMPLLALLGGVGILLLISCANAANLQITRSTGRMQEMNVRSILGASFARLLQQVATESAVLSLIGAALGGAVAYALIAVARTTYGARFSRFDELSIYPGVFATCVAIALLAGFIVSVPPALSIRRHTRADVTTKHATRRSQLPGLLVALQIALTCVLMLTSGLFVRTLRALQEVKLGFDPRGVTTLVLMPVDQHMTPGIARQTVARLLERFNTLPGVHLATMQTAIPFSNFNVTLNGETEVSGRPFQKGDYAHYSMVSSNFVRASGIHLLLGRGFTRQDDSSAAMVALVNQAFVNKYLAGRNPIGTSLMLHRESGDKDSDLPLTVSQTVVGVVENELQGGNLGAQFQPMVYLDYLQLPRNSQFNELFSMMAQFAIRSSLPQALVDKELRDAIKQAAPDMAEITLQPMQDEILQSLAERRLAMRMVAAFGAVALILSAIGIYGVLAYSVSLRRKEIGVRMALGSSRSAVTQIVLRQAATMMLLGVGPGAAAAWVAGRGLKSFLFGVKALDPVTVGIVASMLLLVSLMAATIPALRAAHVDPTEALRAE